MYTLSSDPRNAGALIARSVEAAPGDPVIAFAALQACARISDCDVSAAATRLYAADPLNGFSVMPELESAVAVDDDRRIDAALEQMARRSEWRVYWNRAITRATDVHLLAARALPKAEARELRDEASSHVAATGVTAGILIPAYRPIMAACTVEAGSRRHARCQEIARGLQRGDAVITQSVGYSLELELVPAGSPEHQTAAERQRELMWLMSSKEPTRQRSSDEFRQLQAALPREEDVFREVLRRRGKPTEPPRGWNPAAG
jgi:hypothetical protein